ncbi:MAG: hypothetical protein HC897_00405 [Thermoanaerobaculia bacterium]|nr:hypothetical protein [Thermoanaerobaculia bacterium]
MKKRIAKRRSGFSLIEVLVATLILAEILIGVLILFDNSNRLARSQVNLAEIQQSLRVAQQELIHSTEMAGRGGMPITLLKPALVNLPTGALYGTVGAFPNGLAVAIDNNVADNTMVGTDLVVTGSDILTVRGVISNPVYFLEPPLDISSWAGGNGGEIEIPDRVRIDLPQDIQPLVDLLTQARSVNRPEAFIVRDTYNPNAYAVIGFNTDSIENVLVPRTCVRYVSPANPPVTCINVAVSYAAEDNGTPYSRLTRGTILEKDLGGMTLVTPESGVNDTIELPRQIGSIGLLEEYKYFVRAEWEVPGDDTTRLRPVLSRARMLPGTNTVVDRVDISDNVLDLQIAAGIDTHQRQALIPDPEYGRITETFDENDEVLFNAPRDTESSGEPRNPNVLGSVVGSWFDPRVEYHFLRLNVVVQSDRADQTYNRAAYQLGRIEDYDRGQSFQLDGKTYNLNDGPFRRRVLQTVVELRNLM